MTLKKRIELPVPSFFRKVRKVGLVMAGIGAAIIAAPVALPSIVVAVGGYLTVAGAVTVAVSQVSTVADATDID